MTTLQHTNLDDTCGCLKLNHLQFNRFAVWSEANRHTLHTLMSIQQGAHELDQHNYALFYLFLTII
jgi:hypothetical protein